MASAIMNTTTTSARYRYSIWGQRPGYGYESGWAFGATPAEAVANALRDARVFSAHKFKVPARVYLQPDNGRTKAFDVDAHDNASPVPDEDW